MKPTPTAFPGEHLKLEKLKKKREAEDSNYLYRIVPEYPKPEFHVTRLKHETSGSALSEIRRDGGFRNPRGESLIWWSLAVGPEEVEDAETRLLQTASPDRMEVEGPEQRSFLWRFATSPAFKETSRLGSYRFTFPLQEVLTAYSQQVCSGAEPVMRVYETVLYKQEVMYVVLVHGPDASEKYSEYPLLNDDPNGVCVYRDGKFLWRAEAMCETHWFEQIRNDADQMEARRVDNYQFYVWDHVAVALHVEGGQVLKFDHRDLRKNLKYCEADSASYRGEFLNLQEAEQQVAALWPLEVERPLQLGYPVTELKLVLTGNDGQETSATRNALLGRDAFFPSGLYREVLEVKDLKVNLITTPGLLELSDYKKNEMLKRIRLSGPELPAFLLIIRLENMDAAQIGDAVRSFEWMFGNDALRRTMILFTHWNQYQAEQDAQEVLNAAQEVVSEVGGRYRIYDNQPDHRDAQKVSGLLEAVKRMIEG